MGGLSRRAHIIKQYLSSATNPVLILDAGALFFDSPVLPPSQMSGKKEQAEGIMQTMQNMQYNAIGVASRDLSGGVEFLEYLQEKYTIPFVSANLARQDNGDIIFKPFIIRQIGEISVAIIGLTDIQPNVQNSELLKNVSLVSWKKALAKILPELINNTDMIVLLSSFPELINREIAQQFKEINLILQADHSISNRAPQPYNNSLITQTAGRGKYVGWMDINWTTAKKWGQDHSPRLKTFMDRLDQVNWRLGGLKKRYQGTALKDNVQYQALQKEKSAVLAQIESIKQLQPENLSTYQYKAIALKITLPEDPEVKSMVAITKRRVYDKNKKRLAELRQKTNTDRNPASMAGWKSCRSCHLEQTNFWQKTRHAKAWDSLAEDKQQFNQDCLICHVTLPTYDKKIIIRNNLLATLTTEFHNVSCEACHGPAKKHVEQPEQSKLPSPTAQTCLICHTPDRDDNFDFSEKVKLIRCPVSKT